MPRTIANKPEQQTEINLSPMIDCIFILLIFFIVTTVFVEKPGVDITKPAAANKEQLEKNSIIIAVTADDKIIYGGKELSIGGLGARVRQLLQKDPYTVIIQGDVNADHGMVSKVWTEVKSAGARKISVSTLK